MSKIPRWDYLKGEFASKKLWLDAWLRKNYHRLKIVFVSQFGEGANRFRNDCGAACAVMVAKAFFPKIQISVDEIYRRITKEDRYLWVWEIVEALRRFGINATIERGKTIEEFIDKRRGVIALVNYIPFQEWERNPWSTFRGDHFVTVIGYNILDDIYYVHDPLYPEGSMARKIPVPVFEKAWAKLGKVAIVTVEKMQAKEVVND